MAEYGNSGAGFSVNATRAEIRVVGWGFWAAELATSFGSIVVEAAEAGSQQTIVMDLQRLRPLRPEGQAAFGVILEALPRLGIKSVLISTESQLTKLQLLRLAKRYDTGHRVRVTSTLPEDPAAPIG